MPASETTLIERPSAAMATKLAITETGMATEIMRVAEGERKNSFVGLSFSWDIFRGGQNMARVKSGAAASRAANYRVDDAQRVVVRDVKVAYYEALKLQQLELVAAGQLESRREDLDVTEERYRIAGVTRSDLLGAQGEVAQAELTLLDRRNQARTAIRELQVRRERLAAYQNQARFAFADSYDRAAKAQAR